MNQQKRTKYQRIISLNILKMSILVIIANFFFFPQYIKVAKDGDNMFQVLLNGENVGYVAKKSDAPKYLQKARGKVAKESHELVFVDAQLETEGQERFFGKIDSQKDVVNAMSIVLQKNLIQTRHRAYTLKINEYTVNLADSNEVKSLLQAALNQYDENQKFTVDLVLDPTRELNVLTTSILSTEEAREAEQKNKIRLEAGIEEWFHELFEGIETEKVKEFSDYDLGLVEIAYADTIEVVESYVKNEELTPLEDAISYVTRDQEKNTIYEVVSGDTLSEISLKTNVPLDKIIEINETIENEDSLIRIGDEIIVTIPEPELSIERKEEVYYEENYDAEIEYIYNDGWYTTDSEVRQQPSAGHRKVVALRSYRNDKVTDTEILQEEVSMVAVPKIVEIGTKVPPTYIKPISGGRFTSGFKKRWGRWHKGIDWATPVGTAVVASSGGTVARAGWASGYGYVVYINHADGRQTRYGHLSKVLVKSGEQVKQGQKIALSGNTGRSTGPHVHFEILINGSQVDPFQYMN